MNTKQTLLVFFILATGLANIACQELAGADERSGSTEQQEILNLRAVGSAGENGSLLYAAERAPNGTFGRSGDFYLDLRTGNLYGPKKNGKWGTPIHLQVSADPQGLQFHDGNAPVEIIPENGHAGAGQIHTGETAPDNSLGKPGDYYLNTAEFYLHGPKTENGWRTSINLKELPVPQSPQQPVVPRTPPNEELPGPVQLQ